MNQPTVVRRLDPERAYAQAIQELAGLIPPGQQAAVLGQWECEYELFPDHQADSFSFLGFVEQYRALAQIIPTHFTIVDAGCYLAAQSWLFAAHRRYIGVDVCTLDRFTPPNAEHHVTSIQHFVAGHPDLARDPTVFAICNYVPDGSATRLVRETFRNVFCFYPAPEITSPRLAA